MIDLLKHVLFFFVIQGDESLRCEVLGFIAMLLEHLYLMLNVAIALNLHLVIIKSYPPNPRWEFYYWLIPLSVALTANVPLLALGKFGKGDSDTCLLKQGPQPSLQLEILYFSVPSILTIVYCLGVAILVGIKLRKKNSILRVLLPILDTKGAAERARTLADLRKLILRSTLYPIACFLTHIGRHTDMIYLYLNGNHCPTLRRWGILGFCSAGILNLLAFLSDPLVQKRVAPILRDQFKSIHLKVANQNPISDPTSSTNKVKPQLAKDEKVIKFVKYT